MFTKPLTLEELQQIFVEVLLTKTDKITKVSPGSVNFGLSYAASKIGQKIMKDVSLLEAHIFPDMASGSILDDIARLWGISPRFTSSQSSTYVRVVGDVGTTYTAGVNTFTGNTGVIFDIEQTTIIGVEGFNYIKIRSQDSGINTNVNSLTLTKVSPKPTGHKYCINEFASFGGRDNENDELFRKRIKDGVNVLARGTLSMLEQVFMNINNNVLKCYYHGINDVGQVVIALLSQNGIDFTNGELNDMLLKGQKYFSLSELKPDGFNGYGISLVNVTWQPIDISCRVLLDASYDPDEVRKEIQIRFNKYIDYRNWKFFQKVEWDDLLDIVKTTAGVTYALDQYFFPQNDIPVAINKLPRIRGFLMLDTNGVLISSGGNTLNPVYYPQIADFSYQSTVLNSL